jgi:PAS domain S-box-containing protein
MRALYVATDLRDADVLQQEVRRAAPKLTFDVCSGTAEARTRTEGALSYDVMILDSSLPEHEQQQLIEHVRSRQIPLPIVILVGQGVTPSSAIVSAADECITRGPRLAERLAPGLRMAIERYRVVATVSRENERLKRSEARLRLIIEAMPAGVVLVDQAGKIQAMNLAGAALVGTGGPSDVVGRELYSLADHDGIQALRDLVARAFDGERGKAGFTCHAPDGTLRPLQIEALCIQKDAQGQGSVLGVLSAATGEILAQASTLASSEEPNVEFAFANDQHGDERLALEQALEEMRAEAARLTHEAESERGRVQQVLEELERSRATAAEHHAQKTQIDERHRAAEARVAELEARIAELDARGREAEGASSTLAVRVEQLTAESSELRADREKLQAEREALQAQLAGLRDDLSAQTKAAAEAAVRAETAENDRSRLVQATSTSQSIADAKTKELAADLKAANARAEATEKALKAEIETMRADAARVADALEAQGKDRKGAEAALAAARDALQARVEELDAQASDLEARRQAAVARVAELEEMRRGEQASLAAAAKHEGDLEQQLKAARHEAARAASERDALASELGRAHESHRAAADEASVKASDAARARAELDDHVHQLQAELDRMREERQSAQDDLDATKAQADGVRGELETLRSELEERRTQVEQRAAELEQRQAELGQARGELDQIRGELEATRATRDAHAREAEEAKVAVAKAATLVEELRHGRDAVDARAHAATGELDVLRREIEASRHHASDLQQALDRERADARERAATAEREHQDALARLHKQIEEAREFQAAAAASRSPAERGRRRQGERLGQLASAMANDLHGIVNGMVDEGRKLLGELPEGSDVRAQAEHSLQSANRAGQLVRHLLRLSEREARATSGSDPNSVVRANEPMLRQLAGPDIDLRFELAPGLPSVESDADELTGVLSTLMVTVRGALPLGGSIRVTTQPPRKDGGRRRNDASLVLALVAEGYGMVSVPTTVCDEVVTRSGGTFSAQVDLKGGSTTFTAYLPVDQTADAGVTNIA